MRNLTIGIITTVAIIIVFMSTSLYKSKIQLQQEVYNLKSKMEDQNKNLTSQLNENTKLKETVESYKADVEQNIKINEQYEKLVEQNKNLLEIKKQNEYLKSAQRIKEYSQGKTEFFPLYHASIEDIDGYNEEERIDGYILVDKNLSIKEKMQLIANNISRSYLGLPIEVEKIEERNGKKIALINLVEYTEDEWDEWSTRFQGTTREGFTISTLESNFIQPLYFGEWVDGIEIQQNHGTRTAGHIGGGDWIVYRTDLLKKYELNDFIKSDGDKETLEIIEGKIISKDGEILIQESIVVGKQWVTKGKLTIITRVDFTYYDGKTHSPMTIETLTLDLTDGSILKRYIGKGRGVVKEELLYPDSLGKN